MWGCTLFSECGGAPCLVSVGVLMRGSGMGEYEAGKETIKVYSLQKNRLHHC